MMEPQRNSPPPSWLEFGKFAEELARNTGQFLLTQGGSPTIREKAPGDWVTSADEAAQALIFQQLKSRYPDHGFLGEEAAPNADWYHGWCWIVDPIDGTRNFIYRLPSFSVSLALFYDGRPVVGVVHDPILNETYSAIATGGAYCNGGSIRPTSQTDLDQSLLVCSFPAKVTADTPELIRFNRVVQRATLRRLGSAALNLCYVASGRLDGYWASSLSLWDYAAGMLIAREAGAWVRNLEGTEFSRHDSAFCATSTEPLGRALLPLLQL